jgi:hypothetical protein
MNMKNIAKMITLVIMLGIVTISCNKDDEEPNPVKSNTFTIDGTEYSLSAGFTEEYGGDATTGYNFDLIVHSSGLTATADGVTGQGEALYFELWSTSSTGLAAGTYTAAISEVPNTFTIGEAYINLNASTFSSDEYYEVTAGSVSISISGSTYTINFDLTLEGGKKLTGNYTGTLAAY